MNLLIKYRYALHSFFSYSNVKLEDSFKDFLSTTAFHTGLALWFIFSLVSSFFPMIGEAISEVSHFPSLFCYVILLMNYQNTSSKLKFKKLSNIIILFNLAGFISCVGTQSNIPQTYIGRYGLVILIPLMIKGLSLYYQWEFGKKLALSRIPVKTKRSID